MMRLNQFYLHKEKLYATSRNTKTKFCYHLPLTKYCRIKEQFYYPKALHWMWTYCIPLGCYQADDGTYYDLGIYQAPQGDISLACVYGNAFGKYVSGPISCYKNSSDDMVIETLRRWELRTQYEVN